MQADMQTRRPKPTGGAGEPTRCPECGAEVRCGAALGEDSCWCAGLPAVEPRAVAGEPPACLCESCLRRRVTEERSQT
jgi:hypothetical protein